MRMPVSKVPAPAPDIGKLRPNGTYRNYVPDTNCCERGRFEHGGRPHYGMTPRTAPRPAPAPPPASLPP